MNRTITIPSSSEDNDDNDGNYVPGEDTSNSRRRKKKKKRRAKKSRTMDESDEFYDDVSASTERVERVTRSATRRRQKEEEQGHRGPSFSELIDQATQSGDNAQISDEDPLISQIAQKMSQIRQINQRRQVGTPEISAPVQNGLDALLMAIEADQPRERSVSNSKSPRSGHNAGHSGGGHSAKNTKTEFAFDDHESAAGSVSHSVSTAQPEMQRKHGELFVVRNGNGTNLNVTEDALGGDCKVSASNEMDLRVQKIQKILGNEYTDCFVVNEQSTFLKHAKDDTLKPDLQRMASQLRQCYHEGLVQVFKTLTDDCFKEKWTQCNGAGKLKYFTMWNEVSPHVMGPMDEWLKHFDIRNAMALIFAVMDHLFSNSMFKHLCGVTKKLRMDMDERKELEQDPRGQYRREKWLPVSGNPLFKEIEHNKSLIREIENTQIHWLFGYWKKVLLKSPEPLKCLARSYLVNSPPNPYKNRLYYMVTSTAHAPYTTVMSTGPMTSIRGNAQSQMNRPMPIHRRPVTAAAEMSSATGTTFNVNSNMSTTTATNMGTTHHQEESKTAGAPNTTTTTRANSGTPPNTIKAPPSNNHFVRAPGGSLSMKGVVMAAKGGLAGNPNVIPSIAVCGTAFVSAWECADHEKKCTKCDQQKRAMSNA